MMRKIPDSLYTKRKLSFLFLIVLCGCTGKPETSSKKISVLWENDRAIGMVIPRSFASDLQEEALQKKVEIRLAGINKQPATLGHFLISPVSIVFKPLIPFTKGLHYQIFINQKLIEEIEIPKSKDSPELLAIYPSQDTLPENLLKFYFVFSRPMAEGNSLQHISLTDGEGDTLSQVFLQLQPELWNENKTILTIWLDPGRIKRNLQPNKMLGNPLEKGRNYRLSVSQKWADEQGAELKKTYIKTFTVTKRDEESPFSGNWKLKTPKEGTKQALEILFQEPLDYILIHHTIQILDVYGKKVEGKWEIENEEKKCHFIPIQPWIKGKYKIVVESRLEDLAGNNLNRLFDKDLKSKKSTPVPKNEFEIEFEIEK